MRVSEEKVDKSNDFIEEHNWNIFPICSTFLALKFLNSIDVNLLQPPNIYNIFLLISILNRLTSKDVNELQSPNIFSDSSTLSVLKLSIFKYFKLIHFSNILFI